VPVVSTLREPTEAGRGDSIFCRIHAFLLGDDYTFRWRTRSVDGKTSRVKAEFDQMTIAGEPLAKETLKSHIVAGRRVIDLAYSTPYFAARWSASSAMSSRFAMYSVANGVFPCKHRNQGL
jgi:hypothetical protein